MITATCRYCGAALPPRHKVLCGSKDCARKENAEVNRRRREVLGVTLRAMRRQRPAVPAVSIYVLATMSTPRFLRSYEAWRKGKIVWVK